MQSETEWHLWNFSGIAARTFIVVSFPFIGRKTHYICPFIGHIHCQVEACKELYILKTSLGGWGVCVCVPLVILIIIIIATMT